MINRKTGSIVIIAAIVLLSGCNSGSGSDKDKTAPVSGKSGNSLKGPEIDIFKASVDGDLSTVKAALENGQKANACDVDKRTALMYASYNGHTEILRLLIKNGAEVNLKDIEGRTALMMASSGPFPDAVRLLLDNYADPNIRDKTEHFTAIMFAASEGQTEIVKILLSRGADPALKDIDGDDAYSFALKAGHNETGFLLKPKEK